MLANTRGFGSITSPEQQLSPHGHTTNLATGEAWPAEEAPPAGGARPGPHGRNQPPAEEGRARDVTGRAGPQLGEPRPGRHGNGLGDHTLPNRIPLHSNVCIREALHA